MQPQLAAFPAVELRGVVVRHVVEHDEDLREMVLDDGGQRALPREVLAAERQPPAHEPAGPGHRRVRGTLLHLRRIHVRPVGGIQRHPHQSSAADLHRVPVIAGTPRGVRHGRTGPGGCARVTRIVIMGGGPAGYEAALVAAQHGADVTVVERDGMGGACVLDDCVPSKTLIASAGVRVELRRAADSACRSTGTRRASTCPRSTTASRAWRWPSPPTSAPASSARASGSSGARPRFADEPTARGRTPSRPARPTAAREELPADVVLVATGATPRVLDDAQPDGERILTWRQLYDLTGAARAPVVVGSGRHGRRVLLGLRRDGQRGHAGLQPRPRAAGRGRRRRRGAAGRVRRARRADRWRRPGRSRCGATATAWSSRSPTAAR